MINLPAAVDQFLSKGALEIDVLTRNSPLNAQHHSTAEENRASSSQLGC
jgi:hypothetical protein